MQKRIKDKFKDIKDGFSVAEMLLVLLILSFLVLALPPIVHKKVEKRITRGEHGRYECWRDPDTGALKEFYATERNGADPRYLDAAGNPVGEEVAQCRFSPHDQAPNAAYFSFQAIGGGAGGAYPPYDPTSTNYKNDSYTETATIYRNAECNCSSPDQWGSCKLGYQQTDAPTITNNYYDYHYMANGEMRDGSGADYTIAGGTRPCASYTTGGYKTTDRLYEKCINYKNSINYWASKPETNWISSYFIPVQGRDTMRFCSGKGYTGAPLANNLVAAEGGEESYDFFYGGKGGEGACYKRPGSDVTLTASNNYRVEYSDRESGEKTYSSSVTYAYPSYTDNNGSTMGKGFFFVNDANYKYDYRSSITNCSMYKAKTNVYPTYKTIAGINSGCNVIKLSWEFASPENAEFESWQNPRTYEGHLTDASGNPILRTLYTVGGNTARCGQWFASNYVKIQDSTANCRINPGYNGHEGTTELENVVIQNEDAYKGDKGYIDCNGGTTGSWTADGWNDEIEAQIQYPTFPRKIEYKRTYGYDTPTVGFAGTPGTSVSMFLPKLKDDLTFDIGLGGNPGQSRIDRAGSSGGTTTVSSAGTVILQAPGGVGSADGATGIKIVMFGEGTFKGQAAMDATTSPDGHPAVAITGVCTPQLTTGEALRIHGCLDKDVSTDDPRRFADDSQFYTILELDPNTRTPSAINYLYGAEGELGTVMPGTAGDGGYSFIRSTAGIEKLEAIYYDDNYAVITTGYDNGWEREYPADATNTVMSDYTCYKKGDAFDNPTGAVVHYSDSPNNICKPTKGYPGAVVIVW